VTGQVHGLDPIIVPTTNLTFFLRGGYVSLLLPSFSFNPTDVVDVATVLSIPTNLMPDVPITVFNDYIFITNDNAKNYGLMSIDSLGQIIIGTANAGSAGLPIGEFTSGALMGWEENLTKPWPISNSLT
jgi:hypothetical protein